MKKLTCLLLIGVCSLIVHGCKSAPEAEAKGNIPYHATGKARIYFYQTATASGDVHPTVRLDGVNVGTAMAQTSFYSDTTPGEHTVEVSKDASAVVKLKLDTGGTAYVRLNVADGKVSPEAVEMSVGEKEIATCTPAATK